MVRAVKVRSDRPWRAPLCRWPEGSPPHPEVEHNADALAKLGKVCSCECHR